LRRNILGVHHEISKNPDDNFSFLKFFYYPLDLHPKRCITEKREIFTVAVFDKLKSRQENEEYAENLLNSITSPKKKLFIIVNPFSGRKKGGKIADKLSKILTEAGISNKLVKTTHGGHAEKIARTESFSGYDALVTVSGDGLVNEVINGLRQREKNDAPPVAPIPAGSGNGLVASLVSKVPGKHSTLSKAIHALVLASESDNCNHTIDLMKVDYNGSSRFSFLAIATGLVADIDINSERLRFLGGELRNLIYGVAYILRKRSYSIELSVEDEDPSKTGFIGLVVAVCPMLDERVTFFPEMESDPGMYLHQMRSTVTRGQLIKLWDLAEDGGKHVEEFPELANTPVKSIKIKCEKKQLFTIDGEPFHSDEVQITEFKNALTIFY